MPQTPVSRQRLQSASLAALLCVPWLVPFASGPTPNAWPWMVSAAVAVLVWLFRRGLDAQIIAAGWAIAAVLSAVIGLFQYFGIAHVASPWMSQATIAEAFGNLRQRNQFATLTSVGLMALIGGLAGKAPRPRTPWWAYCTVLLLALGNAASGSRTGLLQWILILGLTAWWFFRSQRRLAMLALYAMVTYLVAVVTLPWVLEIVTGISSEGLLGRLAERPTCGSRRVLWSNVLTLIAQRPWLGWGWGELDYAHFMNLYPGARFCEILDNAHNLPLHLAVELGVPVAMTVCAGAVCLVWRMKPWREGVAARQMAWGVLAIVMLHSLLEYPLWYGPFQIAMALSVGLLWVVPDAATIAKNHKPGDDHHGGDGETRPVWGRLAQASIAVGLMALLIFAGIDYHRVSQIYLPAEQRSPAYRDDTLRKVRDTWFFRNQADFAELSMTTLKPENAEAMYALARRLIHYSPEPSVVEKLIESTTMLGKDDEALFYLVRYRAAFPEEHARWARAHRAP